MLNVQLVATLIPIVKEKKNDSNKNLKTKYTEDVVPALKEKFGYKNDHQVPKLVKIVLNMGVGEASHNSKIAEAIEAQLTKIAGQHAVVTKAKNQSLHTN